MTKQVICLLHSSRSTSLADLLFLRLGFHPPRHSQSSPSRSLAEMPISEINCISYIVYRIFSAVLVTE